MFILVFFAVVMESSVQVLKKLVERGAMLNCMDVHGQTCVMQAILSGHQEVVKLLVDSGADLTARNIYHNTALDLAQAQDLQVRGMLKVVLPLIKKHLM
jgi:ankyrin repeat protein